jgi:hypothetical protein
MRLARDTVHPEQAAPLNQSTVGPPALGGIIVIVDDVADGPAPPDDPPLPQPTTAAE